VLAGGQRGAFCRPSGLEEGERGTLRFPGLTAWATTLTPSGLALRGRRGAENRLSEKNLFF